MTPMAQLMSFHYALFFFFSVVTSHGQLWIELCIIACLKPM
jgi:hypothetical protein